MPKFKLEKLKISAFTDGKRTLPAKVDGHNVVFEAMFNPESISQSLAVQYANPVGMGSSSKSLTYSYRPSTTLAMKLILDEGYYNSILENLVTRQHHKSVKARVQGFLAAAYDIDSAIHQPRWLRLEWGGEYSSTTRRKAATDAATAAISAATALQEGDIRVEAIAKANQMMTAAKLIPTKRQPCFDCRLSSVDIKYTSFDREGNPTGAELDIVLIEDISDALRVLEDNFQSPDVTHFRVVKAGDTLPLLSNSVYGDPSYYLTVAQFNGLDDFRNLQAGQKLYFPPLT